MSSPLHRVTLRDIAKAANCHFSTVSLALNDHPRLPAETKAQIRRIADELGYVADPMLLALAHYRTSKRPQRFRSTLAWVTNFPTRNGWRSAAIFNEYFLGAVERAQSLGYRLEPFWLREPGMTAARASQILRTRNITGLIIAPQPAAGTSIELDWSQFCAAAIGYTLASPALHLIGGHQYRSMRLALRRLLELGYRRLGLVMLDASDERADHNWLAAYLVTQQQLAPADRLPALMLPQWNDDAFLAWQRQHGPDAIVTKSPEALSALRGAGVRVPSELGIALMSLPPGGDGSAGVDENPREVGAAAVNYVAGMIHRNERGIPPTPQRLLIEGRWIGGGTVRDPQGRASPSRVAAKRRASK